MRKLMVLVPVAFAFMAAAGGALSVPQTVVNGVPGSTHVLGSEQVAAGDVGKTCTVSVQSTNNESTREGTDLIVTTGWDSLIVANVEHAAGVVNGSKQMVLGPTLTLSVRLGAEGVYSGAATSVVSTCPLSPPVTTTVPAPPAPPTVAPPKFTG